MITTFATHTAEHDPDTKGRKPKRRRATQVQDTPVDRIFMVGVYVLLSTFLLIVLVPLINILASSFSSPAAVSGGRVFLLPVDFTLVGYEAVLSNKAIVTGFANSVFYAVVGTLVSITLTVMIAYPLSRSELVGRRSSSAGSCSRCCSPAGSSRPTWSCAPSACSTPGGQ